MRTDKEIANKGVWNIRSLPIGMTGFIKLPDCKTCTVIWTRNEGGYDHVSVTPKHKTYMPTWDDMCLLKDIFFKEQEEAYQFHPPTGHNVNTIHNCLHLWKPTTERTMKSLEAARKLQELGVCHDYQRERADLVEWIDNVNNVIKELFLQNA